MDERTKRKMVKPKDPEAKTIKIQVRISEEDMYKLSDVMVKTGMSKSDIIRKGITNLYNIYKYS